MDIVNLLKIRKKSILSVTGAGGKTSLMYTLAESLSERGEVLITTTTKISADIPKNILNNANIRVFAVLDMKENKYKNPGYDKIEALVENYDYTIIEADGSKGLPLKGYYENEPCVVSFATTNIAVVSIRDMGLHPENIEILRKSEFINMSKAAVDRPITDTEMARWIEHPKGMFKDSKGERILFFNQIESEDDEEKVRKVISSLSGSFKAGLSRIIAGSIFEKKYKIMEKDYEIK